MTRKTNNARVTAVKVLEEVIVHGAYANLALNKELQKSQLSQRDKSFATSLVYGNLEKWQPVDFQLARLLKKPLKKKDIVLAIILHNGVYEMLYAATPARAAVNENVELVGSLGRQEWRGLVNGVLRNFARNSASLTWPEFTSPLAEALFFASVPDWIGKMWLAERGAESALSLVQALSNPTPLTLRVNSLKTDRERLLADLHSLGFAAEKTAYSPEGINVTGNSGLFTTELYKQGYFTVQGEASQLAVKFLAPVSGARVLDMCAAPGGKTTYIAETMADQGEIWAADVHKHKVELIKNACTRLGLTSVQAVVQDSLVWGQERPGYFNYILLDAPCSGLGVLSQRQDARFRKNPEDIEALVAIQRQLIDSAVKALAPGGRLIYSTCTISQRENLANRQYLLDKYPAMGSVDLTNIFSGDDTSDSEALKQGYLELLPYKHGVDGFFISAFSKEE